MKVIEDYTREVFEFLIGVTCFTNIMIVKKRNVMYYVYNVDLSLIQIRGVKGTSETIARKLSEKELSVKAFYG